MLGAKIFAWGLWLIFSACSEKSASHLVGRDIGSETTLDIAHDPAFERESGLEPYRDLALEGPRSDALRDDDTLLFDQWEMFVADLVATDKGFATSDNVATSDIVTDVGVQPSPPPDKRGPWDTQSLKTEIKRGNRTIPILAYFPKQTGLWPLVVFLPGFQVSLDLYAVTLDYIASHGFATVGAQPPGSLLSVSHVEMTSDTLAVVDWALGPQSPLATFADANRIAVVGHSLGGKLAVMAAYRDARVQTLVGLDPVNGGNPLTGYSQDLPDIVPDQVAPLKIPLGFIGEDWSAMHASFGQYCNPADQNYRTFYDAATSSPWKARWTLGGADHMDFVDNPSECGFVCSVCPDGPGEDAEQIAGARALIIAFLRRHLNSEITMDAWLTGDLVPKVVTEMAHLGPK